MKDMMGASCRISLFLLLLLIAKNCAESEPEDFSGSGPTDRSESLARLEKTDNSDLTDDSDLTDGSGDYGESGYGPEESGFGYDKDDEDEAATTSPLARLKPTNTNEDEGSAIDIDFDEKSYTILKRPTERPDIDVDGPVGSGLGEESRGPCEHQRREADSAGRKFRFRCAANGDYRQKQCVYKDRCRCVDVTTGKNNGHKFNVLSGRCLGEDEPSYVQLPGDKGLPESGEDEPEKQKNSESLLTSNPGLMAGIIGGAVVGLLILILLVMFVVYRMRKKDEGSYALEKQKKPVPPPTHPYQPCPQEYYA